MKHLKLLVSSVIVILLGGIGIVAYAGSSHYDQQREAQWVVNIISMKMDLDNEQTQRLEAVKDEIILQHNLHLTDRQATFDRVLNEIKKPTVDPAFFQDLIEQQKQKIDQISPAIIDKLALFHQSLTVEQKDRAIELLKRMKNHHH